MDVDPELPVSPVLEPVPCIAKDRLEARDDDSRTVRALRAIGRRELDWCMRLNRHLERTWLRRLMSVTSQLGDGWIWGVLILGLAASGDGTVALRLAFAAATTTLTYKLLKAILGRRRPCDILDDFHLPVPPLDRWSFPSGHTMHAVALSTIACYYYPSFGVFLYPFAGLIMMSRVLLGLHYPSDVLAALVCGYMIAALSISLPL